MRTLNSSDTSDVTSLIACSEPSVVLWINLHPINKPPTIVSGNRGPDFVVVQMAVIHQPSIGVTIHAFDKPTFNKALAKHSHSTAVFASRWAFSRKRSVGYVNDSVKDAQNYYLFSFPKDSIIREFS
jgi:hypothetical protein